MTDKAYIVVNEQQEREVLDKLYIDGMTWCGGEEATQIIPSDCYFGAFPYVIFVGEWLSWNKLPNLEDEEIVFDGRKEEKMADKYVVSQEFMNELEEWRKNKNLINELVWYTDIESIPEVVKEWWVEPEVVKEWWAEDFVDKTKTNNRLIAIIRWVNGEDVFEVKKTKKWVVRSKETDSAYCYAQLLSENNNTLFMAYSFANATRFDTKEEAESWANSHQEVVEVEA